jgi:predicted MPP superfamily phosphohydrolase
LPPNRGLLLLAGHTHGGQIRLPGVGALVTNDTLPRALAQGLHAVGGNWMHVTRGVGVSGPLRWRFRCPPEIAQVDIEPAGPSEADCRFARRTQPIAEAVCGR